jgi:hypothetical protein
MSSSKFFAQGLKAAERHPFFLIGGVMRIATASVVVALLAFPGVSHAEDVSLKSAPPVVVKTVPEAGSSGVDAATTKIKVTFSKAMSDRSWSWVTISKESYPETTGRPHYEKDKRTCVLPVKLKADTTYAIWINSEKFGNFKDADGNSAVPYLLVFKTKP